jgi:hypothetical protein
VHLRIGEAPRHGRTGGTGADDQHIHGIVHTGLSSTWLSMPLSALKMQCGNRLETWTRELVADAASYDRRDVHPAPAPQRA